MSIIVADGTSWSCPDLSPPHPPSSSYKRTRLLPSRRPSLPPPFGSGGPRECLHRQNTAAVGAGHLRKPEQEGRGGLSLGFLALPLLGPSLLRRGHILGGGWGHVRSSGVAVPAKTPAGPASTGPRVLAALRGNGVGRSLTHAESPDTSRRRQAALLPLVQIPAPQEAGEMVKDGCFVVSSG